MTDPVSANILVRSINHEILGMDGPNHLISQILPPIAIVNPSSYRLHAMNNRLTFSSVSPGNGRLGIFAAQKGSQQRAMILLLPPAGAPWARVNSGAVRLLRDQTGWSVGRLAVHFVVRPELIQDSLALPAP